MKTWWIAARDPAIDGALRALHEHAATVAALNRPVCLASGRCCQFAEHGHMLAVTGLEALWVWQQTSARLSTASAQIAQAIGQCGFLDGKLCSIHPNRPTGCRTYFCDRGDGQWQSSLGESLHQALRALHTEHQLPYLCAEWTWLLTVLARAESRGVFPAVPLP